MPGKRKSYPDDLFVFIAGRMIGHDSYRDIAARLNQETQKTPRKGWPKSYTKGRVLRICRTNMDKILFVLVKKLGSRAKAERLLRELSTRNGFHARSYKKKPRPASLKKKQQKPRPPRILADIEERPVEMTEPTPAPPPAELRLSDELCAWPVEVPGKSESRTCTERALWGKAYCFEHEKRGHIKTKPIGEEPAAWME